MTTSHQIAQRVAQATGAADAGVSITVQHRHDEQTFVIWAIGTNGRITEHQLCAACTDEARLTAHAAGFISNHAAAFAEEAA